MLKFDRVYMQLYREGTEGVQEGYTVGVQWGYTGGTVGVTGGVK